MAELGRKRKLELTETGEFTSLYVPPLHTSPKTKGANEETLSPITIEPVRPTWRDFWAILRGRYSPKLRVQVRIGSEGLSFILRETWRGGRVEEQLYADSPLLAYLEEK